MSDQDIRARYPSKNVHRVLDIIGDLALPPACRQDLLNRFEDALDDVEKQNDQDKVSRGYATGYDEGYELGRADGYAIGHDVGLIAAEAARAA